MRKRVIGTSKKEKIRRKDSNRDWEQDRMKKIGKEKGGMVNKKMGNLRIIPTSLE